MANAATALGAAGGIALETIGLGFVYPDGTRALTGVSLHVAAGEHIAIVGQNGSGKSTLIRHFNGLLRASEGQVRVAAAPVGTRHVAELARQVAVAFQNPDHQIFSGGVADEVAFGARSIGLRGRMLGERVAAALESVGLAGMQARNPYDLGYSRRKLLATASVVAMGSPAIVLDEPTTGQDAAGVARVASLIGELSALGRTIVAVSHDMEFVADNFARVVAMREGRIVLDGPAAEVFAEANWPILAGTHLQPPLAARVGARLGVGPTPNASALVAAMRAAQL